jgi:carbonic anhydrase
MDSLLLKTRVARESASRAETALREKLSHGQKPQIFYIGCSDSRVLPSRVLGAKPGDVLSLCNVANIIPPADCGESAVGAALEHGIAQLHIPHLVLCGHTLCGEIQALGLPPEAYAAALTPWLGHAGAILQRVPESLRGRDRLEALVEANVCLQMDHLMTYAVVREAVAAGTLTVHGWVYDVQTGLVRAWDAAQQRFIEEAPFAF